MLIIDSKTFIHYDGIKTLINYDLSIKKKLILKIAI